MSIQTNTADTMKVGFNMNEEIIKMIAGLAKVRRAEFKHADPAKGEAVDATKEYHRGFTEGLEYAVKLINMAMKAKTL